MTKQYVQIQTYDFGASLSSVTLRNPLTDAVVATADSCPELSADAGIYRAEFDETSVIAAGLYRLRAVVSGSPLNRWVTLTGVDAELAYSRMERAAELDSDARSMVTAFNAMRSGNVFTAPALANAPTGSGDNQEVLAAIADVTSAVAAYAARIALEVQLKGFPSVLCRNADYLEEVESEIRLTLEDVAGQEITEIAGTPVASLSWLFGAGTQTEPNLFDGTCSWDAATDELVVEIPATATAGKKLGALTWQVGVTISQKTRWLGGGTTRLIERQF